MTYVVRVEGGVGASASDNELDPCSVIIATNILYKSWQRPGATQQKLTSFIIRQLLAILIQHKHFEVWRL